MKDNVVYQDTVSKAVIPCGFCSTGSHDSCKGGYRNGNGSVLICGCECADSKPQFCHHCHTTEPDFLGRPWLCDDRSECEGRLQARLNKSPILKLIQETRTTSVPGRSLKQCLCCGAPTRGGKFLPGHDSKYLNQILDSSTSVTWMSKYKELEAQVSPAFAEKYKKRVYGA